RVTLTFLLVCVGWVFFRAGSLAVAATVLERMVMPVSGIELTPDVALLVGLVLGVVLAAHLAGTFADVPRLVRTLPAPVLGTVLAGGFLLARLLAPDTGGSFIYFPVWEGPRGDGFRPGRLLLNTVCGRASADALPSDRGAPCT